MNKVIFLYIGTVFVGIVTALAGSTYVISKVWENHETVLFGNSSATVLNSQNKIHIALSYKEAFESQNSERFYEITCLVVGGNIGSLDITNSSYLSNRKNDFNKTKEEAEKVLQELNKNGYCK